MLDASASFILDEYPQALQQSDEGESVGEEINRGTLCRRRLMEQLEAGAMGAIASLRCATLSFVPTSTAPTPVASATATVCGVEVTASWTAARTVAVGGLYLVCLRRAHCSTRPSGEECPAS